MRGRRKRQNRVGLHRRKRQTNQLDRKSVERKLSVGRFSPNRVRKFYQPLEEIVSGGYFDQQDQWHDGWGRNLEHPNKLDPESFVIRFAYALRSATKQRDKPEYTPAPGIGFVPSWYEPLKLAEKNGGRGYGVDCDIWYWAIWGKLASRAEGMAQDDKAFADLERSIASISKPVNAIKRKARSELLEA